MSLGKLLAYLVKVDGGKNNTTNESSLLVTHQKIVVTLFIFLSKSN